MHFYGWDFKQATRWLQERYLSGALVRPVNTSVIKNVDPLVASPNEVGGEYLIDPDIYEWILHHSPLQDDGRIYLNARKLSDKTPDEFRVGQIGSKRGAEAL